jgi:hypothetical protein
MSTETIPWECTWSLRFSGCVICNLALNNFVHVPLRVVSSLAHPYWHSPAAEYTADRHCRSAPAHVRSAAAIEYPDHVLRNSNTADQRKGKELTDTRRLLTSRETKPVCDSCGYERAGHFW